MAARPASGWSSRSRRRRPATLSFDVGNAPFQVEVFGIGRRRTSPTGFAGWGPPLQPRRSPTTAAPCSVATPVPARHLLIVLRELGRDAGCTAANPHRGSIGEITLRLMAADDRSDDATLVAAAQAGDRGALDSCCVATTTASTPCAGASPGPAATPTTPPRRR